MSDSVQEQLTVVYAAFHTEELDSLLLRYSADKESVTINEVKAIKQAFTTYLRQCEEVLLAGDDQDDAETQAARVRERLVLRDVDSSVRSLVWTSIFLRGIRFNHPMGDLGEASYHSWFGQFHTQNSRAERKRNHAFSDVVRKESSEAVERLLERSEPSSSQRKELCERAYLVLMFYCEALDVPYRHGLHHICAMLLLSIGSISMNFEIAHLMHHFTRFLLPSAYTTHEAESHSNLEHYFYMFQFLLVYHDPILCQHLTKCNIGAQYYATPWFLALFSNELSLAECTLLWDTCVAESDRFFPFFVALALLIAERNKLLKSTRKELPGALAELRATNVPLMCRVARRLRSDTPPSFRQQLASIAAEKKRQSSPNDAGGVYSRTMGAQPVAQPQPHASPSRRRRGSSSSQDKKSEGPLSPSRASTQQRTALPCLVVPAQEIVQQCASEDEGKIASSFRYTVVDTRSATDFAAGHLIGALHVNAAVDLASHAQQRELLARLQGLSESAEDAHNVHFCLVGWKKAEGSSMDSGTSALLLWFLQNGFPRVSVCLGGYQDCHAVAREAAANTASNQGGLVVQTGGWFDGLLDAHDASVCRVCCGQLTPRTPGPSLSSPSARVGGFRRPDPLNLGQHKRRPRSRSRGSRGSRGESPQFSPSSGQEGGFARGFHSGSRSPSPSQARFGLMPPNRLVLDARASSQGEMRRSLSSSQGIADLAAPVDISSWKTNAQIHIFACYRVKPVVHRASSMRRSVLLGRKSKQSSGPVKAYLARLLVVADGSVLQMHPDLSGTGQREVLEFTSAQEEAFVRRQHPEKTNAFSVGVVSQAFVKSRHQLAKLTRVTSSQQCKELITLTWHSGRQSVSKVVLDGNDADAAPDVDAQCFYIPRATAFLSLIKSFFTPVQASRGERLSTPSPSSHSLSDTPRSSLSSNGSSLIDAKTSKPRVKRPSIGSWADY